MKKSTEAAIATYKKARLWSLRCYAVYEKAYATQGAGRVTDTAAIDVTSADDDQARMEVGIARNQMIMAIMDDDTIRVD